jgi:hypothetical protein
MAEYRIRETGEIVTNLAAAFPNTSLPAVLTVEDLDALGVDPVFEGAQAQPTPFQVAYRDGVEEVKGRWFTKYAVADMEQEAIDATTATQWGSIRTERNRRLADCDWTQLPDASADAAAWAVHRQALRDMTTQTDPFNIVWPVPPSAGE